MMTRNRISSYHFSDCCTTFSGLAYCVCEKRDLGVVGWCDGAG